LDPQTYVAHASRLFLFASTAPADARSAIIILFEGVKKAHAIARSHCLSAKALAQAGNVLGM